MSLLEIKIRMLRACASIDRIVVSSDNAVALELAHSLGAKPVLRSPELCGDEVDLGRLFRVALDGLEDSVVYWAHVTSPFVRDATVSAAMELVSSSQEACAVGVELLHEFLWDESGPHNYRPEAQPRSQNLAPLWRVTGGIHVALGRRFIENGALVFRPTSFIEMGKLEGLDINTPEEWQLCESLAPSTLPGILK